MKTRTVTRRQAVAITRNGKTHTGYEDVQVEVPVPPVDWERLVRGFVLIGTFAFVGVSIAWTTASVGDLLARAVTSVIAYAAAAGFDLAWIVCLGLEWLARYDRRRARPAMWAGWAFLALAVTVVAIHGAVVASWPTAAAGAAVSVIAKALWMLTMHQFGRRLDPLTEQWLAKEQNNISAEMALIGQQRALNRARAQIAAERSALGLDAPSIEAAEDAAEELEPAPRSTYTKREARRPEVVYFVIWGDRVKIGAAVDPERRVRELSLPPDNIVLTVPGGYAKEREFHRRFDAYRIKNSEWFKHTGELRNFLVRHMTARAQGVELPVDDYDDAPELETDEAAELSPVEAVTDRVMTPPTPSDDASDGEEADARHAVLKSLYAGGYRPGTKLMRQALWGAGHGRLADGTIRGLRQALERLEPELRNYPPMPTHRSEGAAS